PSSSEFLDWKSPDALSRAVTVKLGLPRMRYCSIRDPADVARNFCSFTHTTEELTKLTPFTPSAASLSDIRNVILSSTDTSKGSFSNELFQVVTTLGVGASLILLFWKSAFALAISTASFVTRWTSSTVTSGLALNPQVPLTSTRTPNPKFSFRETF